jgi:hypothetical protein
MAALNVPATVRTLDVDTSARPLGTSQARLTTAVASTQNVQPASSLTVTLPPSINQEAAWLYRSGWPLYALVDKYATGAPSAMKPIAWPPPSISRPAGSRPKVSWRSPM